MLLFVVRKAFQESLCFRPFELVFERSVGGPDSGRYALDLNYFVFNLIDA
jgi:hypothetical protein